MPGPAGFKNCTPCAKAFPVSDPHDRCLRCLGEQHGKEKCKICKAFKPRTQKERNAQLKVLLMELALRPESEPSRSPAAPSISSVRSAPLAPASAPKISAPKKKAAKATTMDSSLRHSPMVDAT